MKLLFTNFHDGDGGGHTTYILGLARGLAARHEVHVAAPPTSRLNREARAIPGVRVLDQPFPNGLGKLPARRRARRHLAEYLHRERFDVIHVNGSADHRLVMAARRGLAPRPPIVLTKHNSKPMTGLGHVLRSRFGTDQVIAVCEFVRRQVLASPYARCRVATVFNGVDVERFTPSEANPVHRAIWLAPASATPPLLIGSNAGTARYKGWMDLLEALASLAPEQRAHFRVVLAGGLPGAEDLARIDALGIAEQVHFTGRLADVRPMVAALDAGFVLSWDVETISFACREMMAMGKPVLVSDYAGLPENIRQGEDGWIVSARDRTAIAGALRRLLAERDALPAMGVAARRHAEADFGMPRFVDATEAVYAALLADFSSNA
ncbi:glycosyltransferase family 4 protein [Luteibacter sp. UNCMF366Tsu5.1]|uniref:glycosyltransferase family 4 protein n=1 Tax=Luteibacter sp. UNCMF366Tsu5.1 TaxID=1502758 RepID=UPI00090891A4|nr:glycosyltransferase family 4 protein [Luteibacter sp. UNCMF366Tsu5.1]SFW71188.1 Glycosyltransferase involved in cell wall bisynthesis [Luteibacter sp. UNCMF366Tsu5.1]